MLYEYAVDPSLLTDWQRLRLLTGKFGAEYGRLVAKMPWNWKEVVKDGLSELSFIDRKRVVELFRRLDQTTCIDSSRCFDPTTDDWLAAAERAHGEGPFHAILARDNPREHRRVLPFEEADETHELWRVPQSMRIERTVEAFVSATELLLRHSSYVHFVDPQFRPGNNRFRQTLEAFLRIVSEGSQGPVVCRYHRLHKLKKPLSSTQEFQKICTGKLAGVVPSGVELRVVRWQDHRDKAGGARFHDRYVLTNIGALSFSYGLDVSPGSETRVSLVSREEWSQVLLTLKPQTSPYIYLDEVVV